MKLRLSLFLFLLFFSPSLVFAFQFTPQVEKRSLREQKVRKFFSVCPPFYLRDEKGQIIDPVHNKNADEPYSPKKTCGQCHDYQRITSAYHFEQGRHEKVPSWMKERYPWIKSPGQYGGRW